MRGDMALLETDLRLAETDPRADTPPGWLPLRRGTRLRTPAWDPFGEQELTNHPYLLTEPLRGLSSTAALPLSAGGTTGCGTNQPSDRRHSKLPAGSPQNSRWLAPGW